MRSSGYIKVRAHLALLAGCLLLADYLPAWHKLWFVAESGHFSEGASASLLLLAGLLLRWRPALNLLYGYLVITTSFTSCLLVFNGATGGPTLGFFLVSLLHLLAGAILYFSGAIRQYVGLQPAREA